MKLNEPKISILDVARIAAETAQLEAAIVDQFRDILRDQLDTIHGHPEAGPWSGPGVTFLALPPPQQGQEIRVRGIPIIRSIAGDGVFTLQFIKYGKANTNSN